MIKDLLKARPVILGRIKLGDKGGEKGQPRKFDGFKIYQPGKDQAGQPIPDNGMQTLYESKYGVPLRKIPIFFLYNTLAANFDCSYQCHKKYDGMDVCVCEGDGEKASQCVFDKDGKLTRDEKNLLIRKEVPCPCYRFNPDPDADQKQHPCKWAAKMSFMLQDVPKGGGYYVFRTHSLNSIRNLYFSLAQMAAFTYDNMAGIPVNLIVEPQKNKKNQTIYIARIEWDFDPRAMRLKAIEEVKSVAHMRREIETAEAAAHKLLAAPDPDEDVQDEFYPESTDEPKSDAKIGIQTAAPKPAAATPEEDKLSSLLKPESTADRLNRERAEEKVVTQPAPDQDAPGAQKKRGRKPKAQAPVPAAQAPAQPATAPPEQPTAPAAPAPPAEEQADLIKTEQPVPDPTTGKQPEGEDVNARFF